MSVELNKLHQKPEQPYAYYRKVTLSEEDKAINELRDVLLDKVIECNTFSELLEKWKSVDDIDINNDDPDAAAYDKFVAF